MYTIKYANNTKTPISLSDSTTDDTLSVTLYGQLQKCYGQGFENNLVRILEKFACPEDPSNPGNPDSARASNDLFSRAIEGQFWFNKTDSYLYYYDGSKWKPISKQEDFAANWGVLKDQEYLPQPVGEASGTTFPIGNCVWQVSPYSLPSEVDYMNCSADNN